jgi:hypothetical protein
MKWQDPSIETAALLSSLENDLPTMTEGQFISWIFRMKSQPREERHKMWVSLSRFFTKEGMKSFKETYYSLPMPDRRPAE